MSFPTTLRDKYAIVVIGAGPAGLAAATAAAQAGVDVLLVDENAAPGGQIYRAVTSAPLKGAGVLGPDFAAGESLVRAFAASGAHYVAECTVWSLDAVRVLGLSCAGQSRLVLAGCVVIATGAMERPFPIPGWTLPGVMSVGAGQTVLKASGLVPDGRIVLAGLGPLLWLYAAQVLRAGGQIEAILETTPRTNYLAAAPHLPAFLFSSYFRKGLSLMREVKRRTRVITGVTALAADGDSRVRAIRWQAGERSGEIEVDTLFLHQGVVPNVNLAMAAGVKHRWDDAQLCFRPNTDQSGATNIDGVYVAGDGAGIGGAAAAAESGRLAAIAAIGSLVPAALARLPARDNVLCALDHARRGRAFIDELYRPARQFRIPADDATLVCRCEEVTAGDIRQSVVIGATGPNQLKAYRRVGMGPCQGRLCGLTVTELMADARGLSPREIGYYRLRAPVKPIRLAELASIPVNEAATKAVVRD